MTAYTAARQPGITGITGTGMNVANLRWTLMFGNPAQRRQATSKLNRLARQLPLLRGLITQTRKDADAARRLMRR